jgi:hypothetical protein
MPEFEERRDALAANRQAVEKKRRELLFAQEALKRAERARDQLKRTAGRGDQAEIARLEEAVEASRAKTKQLAEEAGRLRESEKGLVVEFGRLFDPQEHLPRLPDSVPILLFPLRLETRFKKKEDGTPQLWVRVYPDSCLVDGFDSSLTEPEVKNAQEFWAGIWRAGGDEALERAAWRELVASHGSGRASWIVSQYRPLNDVDKPTRDNEADVLLVVISSGPLPAETAAYWTAIWRANRSVAAEQSALVTLEAAVGQAQAAEIAQNRPFNLTDAPTPPRTHEETQVKVAVLQLTPAAALETRRTSWSSAPKVDLLPDCFVLIGVDRAGNVKTWPAGRPIARPLYAGPDPSAPADEQLKPDDDDLKIPDELQWMFDFDRAVEAGMGFVVDLTQDEASRGFDRLMILGVRLGESPDEGRAALERLLEHHLHSRAGLAIIPQGTPTNNTEKKGSGYAFRDDSDATFKTLFKGEREYDVLADPLLRRDGQWLADLLGIRHDLVQRIPNAGGTDQTEARAMQIALWPGTLGYTMRTLLSPIFPEDTIGDTRSFFTRYVSGRGPLPALRIGRQPYGIVLTTAFDRVEWFGRDERVGFLGGLYRILSRIEDDWQPLVNQVSRIGKTGGDPHQVLLDVLGLHPTSVEYYPLHAESVEQKFYELAFFDVTVALHFLDLMQAIVPLTLLRSFGYTGDEIPDLLSKVWKARQTPLDGPLIDDRPLSERDQIRAYAGNRNYIQWLADAARSGLDVIRTEQGFDGNVRPTALLYLLLRHALQLGYREVAVRLALQAEIVEDVRPLVREPTFVHIADRAAESESHYDLLFREDERITGNPWTTVESHIARNILVIDPDFREQIAALDRIAGLPTARLERIFAETIDTCSYRLDAWKTGLLTWQLERLREERERQAPPGLFLGAFGWVENLRSEDRKLEDITLPADLKRRIDGPVAPRETLTRDLTNAGLVHAPSLNHAATAAVLRNGYLANDGRLAVDLSSRRVRMALEIIDGMRNGQSLGALLGYQFERHVHDHGPLQVRALIYTFRKRFPLAADQIVKTKTEGEGTREAIAAQNVVDGRRLVEHIERRRRELNLQDQQEFPYPFDIPGLPPLPAGDDRVKALAAAIAHVRDINDAVADLVLAEGVHQAVIGNYERSAATLDAFAKGSHPTEPEVVRTPRSGIALTLRTAIHLPVPPPAIPVPEIPAATPLALAEPALNAWLADRLPSPDKVRCRVRFTDPATDTEEIAVITQTDLGLHPIDLVHLTDTSPDQALGDLEDRILRRLHAIETPRHDRDIVIEYTERDGDTITFFELAALLRSLRALVVASRPLEPADLMRANDATSDAAVAVSLPRSRVDDRADHLRNTVVPALDAAAATIGNSATPIDDALIAYASAVGQAADYRLPQSGTGFVFEWRRARYLALTRKVATRVETWHERLDRYDDLIDEYDNLPPDTPEPDRIARLQAAEALIIVTVTSPAPPSGAYRAALDGSRTAFETKRDDLDGLVNDARSTLATLVADAQALLPLTPFDAEPFDFDPDVREIERFGASLIASVTLLKDDIVARLGRIGALLVEHDATSGPGAVRILHDAGRILFGDDVTLIPEIALPAVAAAELANAVAYSESGDLTEHLTAAPFNRDFPVDDWLHGVARVRDKMRHWENAILLGEAFEATASLGPTPLQLPHVPGEGWFGLEIKPPDPPPPDESPPPEIPGDRLLYTASLSLPFDRVKPISGLLVDEWTEVIPTRTEETGVAFHYDRPNSEPPQAWLLALSAVRNGAWRWDDLVGAVTNALDSAKRRAIEPVHIDSTRYSWFLPATMSSYTFPEISISNNLLLNKAIFEFLRRE